MGKLRLRKVTELVKFYWQVGGCDLKTGVTVMPYPLCGGATGLNHLPAPLQLTASQVPRCHEVGPMMQEPYCLSGSTLAC